MSRGGEPWRARSQTVAGSSKAISSASGQTSTGGPSQPSRANQPEIVSVAVARTLMRNTPAAMGHSKPKARRGERPLVAYVLSYGLLPERAGSCQSGYEVRADRDPPPLVGERQITKLR